MNVLDQLPDKYEISGMTLFLEMLPEYLVNSVIRDDELPSTTFEMFLFIHDLCK